MSDSDLKKVFDMFDYDKSGLFSSFSSPYFFF